MKTRHTAARAAALLVATMLLAGCGASDGADGVGREASGPSTAGVASGKAVARAQAGIPAKPYDVVEGRAKVTDNADGTRTVTSAWGTATVPKAPKRVVTILGYVDFETMLALGVTPVGAGTQGGTVASGFAPHLKERTAGIQPLGWSEGAPVEKIAALTPDLIFAPDRDSYNAVKDLAPTVPAGAADDRTWQDDTRYIGRVLGLGDQAEKLVADYEADAKELADKLAPVAGDRTVASPQVAHDHAQVYVSGKDSFASSVLQDAGLELAPLVASAKENVELSFENLTELDADILFWQVRQKDEDGTRDTKALELVERSPLWKQLPAVKNDEVHRVDNRPWYFPTILSAQQVLDDIEQALLK